MKQKKIIWRRNNFYSEIANFIHTKEMAVNTIFEVDRLKCTTILIIPDVFLCGSVVEHCVSNAKGCGFDSQGKHILIKNE